MELENLIVGGLMATYELPELRELCNRLAVDPESLPHATKPQLARGLVTHLSHRGRLPDLLAFVKQGRPNYAWPDPGSIPPPPSPIPLELPPAATHFTGRGDELEQLLAALHPGRIVTLYGPGGIGKTALAGQAVRALSEAGAPPARFPDGVLFHTFYGRPDIAEAAAHVARAYGLDPNPADPFAAASAALRHRAALLILDGAEEAGDLDPLLAVRGRAGVLITSRRREDVREVGIEVERLPPGDALTLLRALAGDRAADEPAAREICELVGNLPLALRLAGRFMFREGQTAAEYRDWLRATPLAALDFGQRRRDSVPLLLERSAAQVSDAARAALGVAGCLALAPFDAAPIAAALALSDHDARRALGELVNYEMLRRPGERYEAAHALVHAYARERQPVAAGALPRLGDYYTTLSETESAKGLPGYQRLNPDRAHILAVLRRLAAAGVWQTANRLVWAVAGHGGYMDIQGYPLDRIAALEIGLTSARALRRPHDEAAHATHLGLARADIGDLPSAVKRYEEALAIFRSRNDRQSMGAVLGNLGNAYAALSQTAQAIEQYEAALAIARDIGDRRGEGNALGNLGNAYAALGQTARAIEHHEAALVISREIGNRRGEGSDLGSLGNAYAALGQTAQAIEQYEAALAIARDIGDRRGEGVRLGNLGNAYAALGQTAQAIERYEAALAIARDIGDRRGEGSDLNNLANALRLQKEFDRALPHAEQSLAIAQALGAREDEAITLTTLGEIHRDIGHIDQARDHLRQALAIFEAIDSPWATEARATLETLEATP